MARYRFFPLIFLLLVFTACDQLNTSAPTITSFSASPVDANGSATLSWQVNGEVTLLSVDQGVGEVTGQTRVSVSPTQTTRYTLRATNARGEDSAQTTVTVAGSNPPPYRERYNCPYGQLRGQ